MVQVADYLDFCLQELQRVPLEFIEIDDLDGKLLLGICEECGFVDITAEAKAKQVSQGVLILADDPLLHLEPILNLLQASQS